jgi:aerobic-type carbon monoxide dehydrogenase small subunit (CoxS/CutS family)
MKKLLKLRVNGEDLELYVEPWKTLRDVIHDELELTGTKMGCSSGRCGACTVIIDGKAVKSCLILAFQAKEREIITIEGLGKDGLHPLQQAFIDHFAVQCGFCTPGMILTAKALLDENPGASYEEVKEGLKGNLCRCTGYVKIMDAIMAAKEQITA